MKASGEVDVKRESKPEWSEVPAELRDALAEIAGGKIDSGTIAWGGYGPTATFVLDVVDGRRLFCKGTHPGITEEGNEAFHTELAHYQRIPELAQFGPAFRGAAHHEDWHLMMLDFVQRTREVPPWSDETVRGAIAMLARFHANPPARAGEILPIAEQQTEFMGLYRAQNGWKALERQADRKQFVGLFSEPFAAERWLDAHLDEFIALEARAAHIGGPRSWVHHDFRSDNLLFTRSDEPLLVDFPFLAYGPTLMDVVFFLPSLAGEGGPTPEAGLRLYEESVGHRFDADDTRITVATVAGFFAARAGQPDIPGLPRLRWVQKLQLFPCLAWLAALTEIETAPAPKSF